MVYKGHVSLTIDVPIKKENNVVVGSTLASREDRVINALLEVFRILEILPKEDETSTRTTESLVAAIVLAVNGKTFKRGARCRGDDITVFEGII